MIFDPFCNTKTPLEKIFATSGAITRDTVDFVRRTKMGKF